MSAIRPRPPGRRSFTKYGSSLLALILTLCSLSTASAGFDEGLAAFHRSDYTVAIAEFKPLAERGDSKSQFWLAQTYELMAGPAEVSQRSGPDLTQAAFWLSKAAEQGLFAAQQRMTEISRLGFGVEKDADRANDWDRKATLALKLQAEQGDALAQSRLAEAYDMGLGVDRNYAEAIRWLETLAARGDAKALNGLGVHHGKGKGCEKDLVLAYVFYALAEKAAESKLYEHNLASVTRQISAEERAEGQSIADKWSPGMPLPVHLRAP